MDTGLQIRSVQPVNIAPARFLPAPERQVAASDLPETQAVTAAANVPAQSEDTSASRDLRATLNTTFDRRAADAIAEPVRKVTEDEVTKELVFQKFNAETGLVIGQYPDEAMLRLRAYNAQIRQAEQAADQTPHAFTSV
jgi:hypothetical protein